MTNQCQHGQLARVCLTCEHEATIAALTAENARMRDALADKVTSDTMFTGMTTGQDGLRIGLEGGAASLLAEMLAQQFKDGGGVNYLELSFVSSTAAPGEAFIVNVQRVQGKSPHALRAEAEAERDRLREELARARVDAGRYRWLQEQHESSDSGETMRVYRPDVGCGCLMPVGIKPGQLNAAIDAARKGTT